MTYNKCKYFCGHWWNLTSAANNSYTYVSYLVLNHRITCMLQLVKYYYKTLFAANLDQKIQSLLSNICSWEFAWCEGPRQSGCAGALFLHGCIFSWCHRGVPSTGSISSHQMPSHLLSLPSLGEARLVLTGFESPSAPVQGRGKHPGAVQPSRDLDGRKCWHHFGVNWRKIRVWHLQLN